MTTTEQKVDLPIIFTEILWRIEHEFTGLIFCGYKDFKNKIKPIFKAFCNKSKTRCKLNVTTENSFDREECYHLEAQIGIMIGFKYALFEKCCDEFKNFIKCVSRIDNKDKLYILEDGEKKIKEYKGEIYYKLKYYLGQDNVEKWLEFLRPNKPLSKNLLITAPLEKIPEIINTQYEQIGTPQLTMSMSIAHFPFVYFMYFRIDFDFRTHNKSIYTVFIKSLTKTLLVFELEKFIANILEPFTEESFNIEPYKFRDMLIECQNNILKATTDKYKDSSEEFRSKWESSDRLFGELLSFWGFILYINMYIKSREDFQKKYKDKCFPKDGQSQPEMTEK